MDLVKLEELWKVYAVGPQGVPALRGVDLAIAEGEYAAIMGHSGSGKSTLLNMLGCLDRPTRGRYYLGGEDVSLFSDNELSEVRNRRIGFVFQSFNLISGLSLVQNIEVPLFYQGVPRRQRHVRSREMAELVGLQQRLDHRPQELSGGQQQRVAIARALVNDPLLLLADEPTGNLDTHTSSEILALFDELHERGRTVLMVTHERHVAAHAGRVVQLEDGRVRSDTVAEAPAPS
jgi:putative ABC transport system ATP-binding protein